MDAKGVQAGVESLETRARLTGGSSSGALWPFLQHQFSSYCGIDAVRYDGFPSSEFRQADFDRSDWSVDGNVADLVVSLETIEHVENPWAFMRGLARIVKPGAWLAVTTPNQLSWLSLATLIVRHRFSAFPDAYYPIHRTALLESDLRHAAEDCGLEGGRHPLHTFGPHSKDSLALPAGDRRSVPTRVIRQPDGSCQETA